MNNKASRVFVRAAGLLAASMVLSGCGMLFGDSGYFRDRGNDYRKAQTVPALNVPAELKSQTLESAGAPPPVAQELAPAAGSAEVPRPTPLSAAETQRAVRIQKLGEEQWVLADYAPGELWPRLKQFAADNRLSIEREDGVNGLLETGWLVRPTDTTRKERYLLRVEQGLQPNSAELHILEVDAPMSVDSVSWPKTSTSPDRERWMLEHVANYLASGDERASVSLLAQGISTASRMSLVRLPGGEPAIRLHLPFDRAWASLNNALRKASFEIKDLDRTAGTYYVRFDPEMKVAGEGDDAAAEKERPGFFSRLFSWGSDEKPEDTLAGGYQVKVQDKTQWVEVLLQPEASEERTQEQLEELLNRIKGHLS